MTGRRWYYVLIQGGGTFNLTNSGMRTIVAGLPELALMANGCIALRPLLISLKNQIEAVLVE
tara:strand:+ start:292 stop:477 length:186 start_codon:yes stop_codon:yes gene_type:complete